MLSGLYEYSVAINKIMQLALQLPGRSVCKMTLGAIKLVLDYRLTGERGKTRAHSLQTAFTLYLERIGEQ
jgi:hypothetical protein